MLTSVVLRWDVCLSSVCEASIAYMMRKRRQLAHLPNVLLLFVQRIVENVDYGNIV